MRLALVAKVLLWGAALYAALCAAAFAAQRRLLYFPQRQDPDGAARLARALGLAPWPGDGRPWGWRGGAADPAAPRALVLHGNAGSALDRVYLRDVLAPAPAAVVLLEYPGYGPRPGKPTERSIVRAAVDAIDLLRKESRAPLLLVGESLGSAAAALAAAERPGAVDGLLLVTPLSSAVHVARRHYPFLPGFILRDRWRADLALPRYGGPAAFLVAGRDEVVFPDLGRALFDAYPGAKRLWVEEGAGHNDLAYDPRDGRWRDMVGFLLGERG